MSGSNKHTLVPQLRFPEFRNAGGWTTNKLGQISKIVTEKVGDNNCIPYTIISGVGLISQQEKLGRTIAGNSLRNYIFLQCNDFAYNKSATKAYPQGYIACYFGHESAAVPNSIFTCFRPDPELVMPDFLNHLFTANLHGKWLKNRVAVGARANGALQVNNDDLMKVPVPLPAGSQSLSEQKKIADCISSLDDLISVEVKKLNALKTHKKGLMQQIFPREGEVTPRLRFPEFIDAPEWIKGKLSDIADIKSGGTPSRTNLSYWGGHIPWVTTSLIDFNIIIKAEEYITEMAVGKSSTKIFPKNTVLMAMYGQGKTRGKVAVLGIDAATNQACAAIIMKGKKVDANFVFQNLSSRYEEIRKISNPGGQENLSAGLIENIPFSYPESEKEQLVIVESLSSLDDLISSYNQKIKLLNQLKSGLVQKLFPVFDEALA
ncbi:restriction endonuclease subunit S [Klebsiella pneumoniae]|uniref:restriction endonuclease subunit S n=1 Tax=Citrobacter freundii TaxID=546 RepID=UPI0016470400|nr:restriction endonuclease subunit S [Citrobacter freundii]MBC4252785.1 restriction endonuclease subunit S [Klebsiella pneumoniae]WFU94532.1 restriction endonuclease subunit S [Citrobacter freundii]